MYILCEKEKKIFESICKEWDINDYLCKDLWKNIEKLEFTSPKQEEVFNAFTFEEKDFVITPKDVKVFILGQDPYPSTGKNKGRAHGYAFSFSNKYEKAEDSLLNIFEAIKNYKNKIGVETGTCNYCTNLKKWAKENQILLLNTALTYKTSEKNIHQEEWKPFIKEIIKTLLLCSNGKLVVFLWGEDAKKIFHSVIYNEQDEVDLTQKINRDLLVLTTSHPAINHNAYKMGFCYEVINHFKICDEFLDKPIWKDFK